MSDDTLYILVYNGIAFTFQPDDVNISDDGEIRITPVGVGAGCDNYSQPNIMSVSTSEYEYQRDRLAQRLAEFNAGVLK